MEKLEMATKLLKEAMDESMAKFDRTLGALKGEQRSKMELVKDRLFKAVRESDSKEIESLRVELSELIKKYQ